MFLMIHFVVEFILGVPSIHYYLLSPFIFLILTLPIISATNPKSLIVATGLLALILVPSLNRQQFNQEQESLQQAAQLANQSCRDGVEIIFCGTILYHALYPWLDSATREDAKICYSGAGFFWDKYFSGNQIDPSRRVTSDYLITNTSQKVVVLNSSHGQGLRVDIPASWNKEIVRFEFGDPEIESLFVTKATPK